MRERVLDITCARRVKSFLKMAVVWRAIKKQNKPPVTAVANKSAVKKNKKSFTEIFAFKILAFKFVPRSKDRSDFPALAFRSVQLGAQALDVLVNRARVAVVIHSPNVVQKLFA